MEQVFFSSLMTERTKSKKWILLPVSALFHAIIAAALVVVPLMDASSQLPDLKIMEVSLTTPVLPTPPSGNTGAKKGSGPAPREKQVTTPQTPKPIPTSQFVAPVSIPATIEDEEIPFSFGDPNGVEGGFDTGIVGGSWEGVMGGPDDSVDTPALRVSQITRPKLIRRVEPQYPNAAMLARVQGIVVIEAVTDIYGNVKTAKIISGHALLKSAAVAAVKQWIYEPYIVNGVPKPVVFTVSVTFTLR